MYAERLVGLCDSQRLTSMPVINTNALWLSVVPAWRWCLKRVFLKDWKQADFALLSQRFPSLLT